MSPDAMPPALLLTVETITHMNKFSARFVRSNPGNTSTVAILERGPDGEVNRVHSRPAYTMTEAASTANWLNERAKGYPRNEKLDSLYNGRG